jgi:FkbM family methyltransferase
MERVFVRAGQRPGARSRLLTGLQCAAEDAFVARLAGRDNRFRPVDIGGTPVWVDITDHTGRNDYFHRSPYEPSTTARIQACLQPGDVFLDVGANIGFFSVLAALRVGPAGQVIAIEPNPGLRDAIGELGAVNGVAERVLLVPAAAAAASGPPAPLFLSVDSVLSTLDPSRAPLGDFPFDRHVDVPIIAIDDWMVEHPSQRDRLRLVKIDVEGVEADVLKGMRRTLAYPAPAVICETDPGGEADRLLQDWGYLRSTLDVRHGTFGNYLYLPAARPLLT